VHKVDELDWILQKDDYRRLTRVLAVKVDKVMITAGFASGFWQLRVNKSVNESQRER
jgi:hypothetical protein